jgi:lysophospholipase L1-like esterase
MKKKILSLIGIATLLAAGWYFFPWQKDKFFYAALGDSGTTAFNADEGWNNKEYSWATGDKVKSHAVRLRAIFDDVKVINMAIPGVDSSDLPRQAEQAASVPLDYVTILIGANDFCEKTLNQEAFAANIKKSIALIKENSPGAKILLSSLPNIPRVRQVAETMTCKGIWPEAMKHCDVSDTAWFMENWDKMNKQLEKIAAETDGVKYSPALATREITAEGISSVDCFHPSVVGQEAIAEMTWRDGFYSNSFESSRRAQK